MINQAQLNDLVREFLSPQRDGEKSFIELRHEWFEERMSEIRPMLHKNALPNLSLSDATRLYKQMSVGGPRLFRDTFLANGIEKIRRALFYLLYENIPLSQRFYDFAGNSSSEYRLKGVNRAFASTALHLIKPTEYAIWNKAVDGGLELLGIVVPKRRGEHIGEQYIKITSALKSLQEKTNLNDLSDVDEFVELIFHRKIGRYLQVAIEEDDPIFLEGREIFRLHRMKERNSKLVRLAKSTRLENDPSLRCEVCGFSFVEAYGKNLGQGFIEAHHKIPISEIKGTVELTINDLAMVCSNCHRMLHRPPWITVEKLRNLIQRK